METNKNSFDLPDSFYDMASLWQLGPAEETDSRMRNRPDTLSRWCLAAKASGSAITVEVVGGQRFTLVPRAVGTTWLSGETSGVASRGLVVAMRAVVSMWVGRPQDLSTKQCVNVPMLDAVAHTIRANPLVVVGAGHDRWPGQVSAIGHDFVELTPPRRCAGDHPVQIIPESHIDWVLWREPGDSF